MSLVLLKSAEKSDTFYCPVAELRVRLKGDVCYWNVNGRCTLIAANEICHQTITELPTQPSIKTIDI